MHLLHQLSRKRVFILIVVLIILWTFITRFKILDTDLYKINTNLTTCLPTNPSKTATAANRFFSVNTSKCTQEPKCTLNQERPHHSTSINHILNQVFDNISATTHPQKLNLANQLLHTPHDPMILNRPDMRVSGSSVGTSQTYANPIFKYMSRTLGNLTPSTHQSKPQPLPLRKRGLLAVPVSGLVKQRISNLISRFISEQMDVILFHYDLADWSEVSEYKHVSSIRAFGQTKYWFAKRFLTPEVIESYDFIFLWDDDIILPEKWSPTEFIQILMTYHIHVAQPALQSGGRQNTRRFETVRLHTPTIPHSPGRITEFVEVMFPVFSREAWQNCAWEAIPYDGFSYWGIDNIWYPHCSSMGYCRFAIIDAMPVTHLDEQSLVQHTASNIHELKNYTQVYTNGMCFTRPSEISDWISYFRSLWICRYLQFNLFKKEYRPTKPILPDMHGHKHNTHTCFEPQFWPGVNNLPWNGEA